MTDAEIIEFLSRYGHLSHPFGIEQDLPDDLSILTLADKCVVEAVRSHQSMDANYQWRVGAAHGRGLIADGDVGPATRLMMDEDATPRCPIPDWGPESGNVAAATGRGSWLPGCHREWPQNHATTVRVVTSTMPEHLRPHYDAVFANSAAAAAEFGWKWIRVDDNDTSANITISFERGNGWIGLAQVPGSFSCGLRVWAKIDNRWNPQELIREHTTLLSHEVTLHNGGRGHTRGGKGNASIIYGLPTTWRGDPAWDGFVQMFGGEPVPDDEPEPPTDGTTLEIAGQTVTIRGAVTWEKNGFIMVDGVALDVAAMGRTGRVVEKASV